MPNQTPTHQKAASSPTSNEHSSSPSSVVDNISEQDLEATLRVLDTVANLERSTDEKSPSQDQVPAGQKDDDPFQHRRLRPLRKLFAKCVEIQKARMRPVTKPPKVAHQRYRKMLQKQLLAQTGLRRGRAQRLQALKKAAAGQAGSETLDNLVPDGPVHTTPMTRPPALLLTENGVDQEPTVPILSTALHCYCCKQPFRVVHHFYDKLCPWCAALNWTKRHQTAPLHGKVAVVTGARIKIGYQVALKLLRAGATVVATTRFPNAASAAFRAEADFDDWKDRLDIIGLDLRDLPGVEVFADFLKRKFPQSGIDILIHNAAQTIRRPALYYQPVVAKEQDLWATADATHKRLLADCVTYESMRQQRLSRTAATAIMIDSSSTATTDKSDTDCNVSSLTVVKTDETNQDVAASVLSPRPLFLQTGLARSTTMSQLVVHPEDTKPANMPPVGLTDVYGQPLDLRTTNSWTLSLEQVETPEILECFLINALAPFTLNAKLVPLMATRRQEPPQQTPRYIMNVSSMEGKFNRSEKSEAHPHTNMAKAALNMMTRTSARDLAQKHGIYMNSVDTGWINLMGPVHMARYVAESKNFLAPLDEMDGAARILDPIFTASQQYGKFLKDYQETNW